MSSTNVYRDTTAADMLKQQQLQNQANLAPGTAANNFTPDYILTSADEIDITDSVTVNGGPSPGSDIIDITDSVTVTGNPTGLFQITDDSGGGAGVTQPGIIGFSDCG
jgi:hypothetical protein